MTCCAPARTIDQVRRTAMTNDSLKSTLVRDSYRQLRDALVYIEQTSYDSLNTSAAVLLLAAAVEQLLREVSAESSGAEPELRRTSIGRMTFELQQAGILPAEICDHLNRIAAVRNAAAHGIPGTRLRTAEMQIAKRQVLFVFEWYYSESTSGPRVSCTDVRSILDLKQFQQGSGASQCTGSKVFLCHAKEDAETVHALHRRLKEAGLRPWMDKEDLLPGQDW